MELIREATNCVLPPGCLNRIVVVERGPLTERVDLFSGRDQKLFYQAGSEPLMQFAERVTRKVANGGFCHRARALLGDDTDLSARKRVLRNLAGALVGADGGLVEMIVHARSAASAVAWNLLEEMTRDDAFRKIPLRLRRVE